MANVTVENIVIKIGKKEIALNLDEAKELLKVLNDTIGVKIEVVERTIERHHWDHWRVEPYRITWGANTGTSPKYAPNTVMCSLKS